MRLELRDVHVDVAGKPVVRGVSLKLCYGELEVIMEHNGAGKSSLLAGIMGMPGYNVKGSILLDGARIDGLNIYERARLGIGLSFQNPPRMKGVTAKCIPEALEKLYGTWKEKSFYAELLGIKDLISKPLSALSGGELKRVELFLTLA